MHVAAHALAGRDRAGEGVLERMPGLVLGDGRVDGLRHAAVPELGVLGRVPRITVIGVDHVAGRAARAAVVARLVLRAQEPHQRVVEARLVQVEHRNGDAVAGAGPAVRLADIRPARLLEDLDGAQVGSDRVDLRGLGEQVDDDAAAALEDAEDVGGRHGLVGRHRVQGLDDALLDHVLVGRHRALDDGGLALALSLIHI